MTNYALALLVLLMICHWAGDFTHLSNKWMLEAKSKGSPLLPIAAHASVHGALMFIVLQLSSADLKKIVGVCLFQVVTHFAIDVWKGKMNIWYPQVANPAVKFHWYLFGFDQLLHGVVIIVMVKVLT
jgi:hypothetical protein